MTDRPDRPLDRLLRRPAGRELTLEQSRERLSSYVYGNIILLTVTVTADPSAIEHGTAVITVLVTAGSTFLAHVVAQLVGHGLGRDPGEENGHEGARDLVRGSVPIMTSGFIPALLYATAWIGWFPANTVQVAASLLLVARIGMIGIFAQRFSGRRPSPLGLWAGVILAVVALLIVVLKVALAH